MGGIGNSSWHEHSINLLELKIFNGFCMNVSKTTLNDVLLIEPKVYHDGRGFFLESWNKKIFDAALDQSVNFVQDNHSRSTKGVLRGLHYQFNAPQGKLVRVTEGAVLDVAVDMRRSSSTFGNYYSVELTAENAKQLWIPEGFAHGFFVLSDIAEFEYKATNYYAASDEHCVLWDDPVLNINWNIIGETPKLSQKDQNGSSFNDAKKFI